MSYGIKAYKRTNIQTADKRRVVVLLYEGAVTKLNQAIGHLEAREFESQSVQINKVLDIIKFLDNALDFAKGGDIAKQLNMLYIYMRDLLTSANIENDADKIRSVIAVLNTLLDGWRGILESGDELAMPAPPSIPDSARLTYSKFSFVS